MRKYRMGFTTALIMVLLGGLLLTACDSNTEKDGMSELIADSFFGIKLGTTRDEVVKLKDNDKKGLKYKGDVRTGENRFIYYWDEPGMSFEVNEDKVVKIVFTFNDNFKYIEEVFSGKLKSYGKVGMDAVKSVYGMPQSQNKDRNSMVVYTYESKDTQYSGRFIEGEKSLSLFLEKNEE